MPEYLVRFDQEVQYQPDHPNVNKRTSGLCVNAPTPEAAITHALRVTRGAGAVVSVVDVNDAPEEAAMVRMLLTVPPNLPVDPTAIGELVNVRAS